MKCDNVCQTDLVPITVANIIMGLGGRSFFLDWTKTGSE